MCWSKPIRVIPSKRLKHKITGRTASVYGAHPASGTPGDTWNDWEIVQVGWTVENDNGTVGCGRVPWATPEGAQAHIDSFIKRMAS
jgi:hypothetical protein